VPESLLLLLLLLLTLHFMLLLFTAAGLTPAQRAIKEGAIKDAKDEHILAAAYVVCSEHARDLFLTGVIATSTSKQLLQLVIVPRPGNYIN
jgi:hypothetical protein